MITTQLQRLIDAKTDIKEAIENKGVTVSDTALLDEYPSYIDRIEANSGEREVCFEPIANTLTPTNPHKMSGFNVWTDGVNIYYSGGNNLHYKLISETDTELVWEKMTWGSFNNFSGNNVWSDGTAIYYSSGPTHYELDKENLNWVEKSWSGLTNFNGHAVWTDGTDIYYCLGAASNRYILDKETSTWSSVADKWSGLANIYGYYLFSDGADTYHAIIQLVSGGFSYTTVLHKLDGTKFTQLNPNFNFASTAGFNGATLWKYKDKIRSCDLGPMIFDPETASIIPDQPYTPESFIGVGYMFTTAPNKNIKLNLRASTFGNDKDIDYSTTKLYSLCNGQCYRLKHTENSISQSNDEGLTLMFDDDDTLDVINVDTNFIYNGYVYNNGPTPIHITWGDDSVSISAQVNAEIVQQLFPDSNDVDLTLFTSDCQKVSLSELDLTVYSQEWNKYVGTQGGTCSTSTADYFNSDGISAVCYHNPSTNELKVKLESIYGNMVSKNFNN